MTKINYVKMSGAGNDFIIVDVRKNYHQFTASEIAKLSDRKNIGCDQFILIKNSVKGDVFMDIYNSDGSKSGACGNATRCVADITMREKKKNELIIETVAGLLNCKRVGNLIAVNMGQPKFLAKEIPLAQNLDTENFSIFGYEFCAANMGNPHAVTFLDQEISDAEFFELGPKIETHPLFPEKTNVEFARILSPTHIKVRVFERGAGETLACGSGACAVAVLAIKKKLVIRDKIKISFKGGDLFIEWKDNGDVIMTGGFEEISKGVVEL